MFGRTLTAAMLLSSALASGCCCAPRPFFCCRPRIFEPCCGLGAPCAACYGPPGPAAPAFPGPPVFPAPPMAVPVAPPAGMQPTIPPATPSGNPTIDKIPSFSATAYSIPGR